jgi:hypothetical protein
LSSPFHEVFSFRRGLITAFTDECGGRKVGRVTIAPEEKFLVGRVEAAGTLSISPRALDYLVANKLLAARRIGTRVLIPVADLGRFSRGDHPARLAG